MPSERSVAHPWLACCTTRGVMVTPGDAVRMHAVRQFADDPARRAALLRECQDPAQTHAWMACTADTVRKSAWHFVVPGRVSSGYSACVFNQDGSMVVCRADNPTSAYLLQLWQVGQVGQPLTYALGDALVSQSVLYFSPRQRSCP